MNFGPHWATSRNIPPPRKEIHLQIEAQVEFGSLSWNHRSQSHQKKRGKHSKPYPVSRSIIQALSNKRQGLRSRISCGTHQGFAIKAHRPTGIGSHFLKKDGRIFWGNRPVSKASLHRCFPNLQLFDLSKYMRIHNLCPQIELNCFCRRKKICKY